MAQTRGSWPELYDSVRKDVMVVMSAQLRETEAYWRQYYNIKSSSRKFERVHTTVPFGDVPEKAEGAPYTMDSLRGGYTKDFTHVEFGLGFEYTQTAREDDEQGMLTQGARWLAFSARQVQEKRAARPFNNGFTTELTPDGVSWFNTAHVLRSGGGTWRNQLSTDADLSVNSLVDVLTDMQTETKDEAGHLAAPITGLTLLAHPSNEFLGSRILQSGGLQGTGDNDLNTIRTRRNWRQIYNPYLTDTDAWFVGATDKNRHALCTYTRVPITVMPVREDSRTGNLIIKVRFRQSWGVWSPVNWFGTSGA